MTTRPVTLLLLAVAVGCGGLRVVTDTDKSNCRRVTEITATGVPPDELDLGTVRPPLPDGLDKPRAVIIPPQPLPRSIPLGVATIDFPDPNQRKVVVVARSDLSTSTLNNRFRDAVEQAGLKPNGGKTDTRVNGKLIDFGFGYDGRGVLGGALGHQLQGRTLGRAVPDPHTVSEPASGGSLSWYTAAKPLHAGLPRSTRGDWTTPAYVDAS